MLRNLFEQFQTKVELLAKDIDETLTLQDPENLDIYIKTTEVLLKTATDNRIQLQNLLLAFEMKRQEFQQKKHQELLTAIHEGTKDIAQETSHTKPQEIKNNNIALFMVKQNDELIKLSKKLKDDLYKAQDENKELRKSLAEKNQELDSERKLHEKLELQIEDQQKLIHELQPKEKEEKEELQVEKKQIEQVLNKHKSEKHFITRPWTFVKTVKKLEKTLNQNKGDEFITQSAIEKSMISPEKSYLFAKPPSDRSKISETDKLICDLSDSFTRKSSPT